MQENNVTLVTGASKGIGRSLAEVFAQHGHDLVLVARSGDLLQQAARELGEAHSVRARTVVMDLTVPDAADRLYRDLADHGETVDILVNNAGFPTNGRFWENNLGREMAEVRLNLVFPTRLTGLVLPGMVERGRGRVLNVASTAAFQPGPLMAVYYATKAYVLYFTEALAEELDGTGVTATALCPGPTKTEFQEVADITETRVARNRMEPSRVARGGYQGLMAGKLVVVPGFANRVGAFLVKFIPRRATLRIVRKLQSREGSP